MKNIFSKNIKKNWKLSLLLIISILNYGKNIDDVIKEYEEKSYTTKINEVNLKKYDIKDKLYKNGDWNEISITSSNEYTTSGVYEGVSLENTIKYGLVYYKNGYNFTNNEFTSNKVGVNKNINDFFYSNIKYNRKSNEIQKDIQKITNETKKNTEIRDLIDLYKNYKNKEEEISQGKINLNGKKKDYDILTRKYQLGTSSKYDYDLAKYEYETSQLEYDNLEKELKILGEKFIIYNVELPKNGKLDELVKIELNKEDFYALRLNEAENIKLNETLNSTKYEKEKFDYKYPVVSADVGYDFEKKNLVIGLGVTKTIKMYNDTLEDLKNESEKLKLEYEQKKSELVSNVGQQMINYTTYQTDEVIKQKAVEITKADYEIYSKKYELGTDTFSNYVEKRNSYEKAKIAYITAKNELAAFTRKIKYYK
ncbi:MAG: TolC family protein [Leptotrichiaceae bacterium]|nr:TolC family protein [Leptotrichiaceae bacterium]